MLKKIIRVPARHRTLFVKSDCFSYLHTCFMWVTGSLGHFSSNPDHMLESWYGWLQRGTPCHDVSAVTDCNMILWALLLWFTVHNNISLTLIARSDSRIFCLRINVGLYLEVRVVPKIGKNSPYARACRPECVSGSEAVGGSSLGVSGKLHALAVKSLCSHWKS
jgi:hypothetical protein